MRATPRGMVLVTVGVLGVGAAIFTLIVHFWRCPDETPLAILRWGLLVTVTVLPMVCALTVLWLSRDSIRDHLADRRRRIAERAQADQVLRRKEAERQALLRRQQLILDHIPAFVFLTDTAGRFVAANKGFLNILPPEAGDPIGKVGRDVFESEVVASREAELHQVVQEGTTLVKEETFSLRDGRTVEMAVTLAPARTDDGEVFGMVGLGFDITARKRVEAELCQARERAEQVTAELAARAEELEAAKQSAMQMVEDLQRARRTAEATSQAMSEFLAKVSHEVRTPLNGIIGMAELTLETQLTDEQREYLGMVHHSAEALLSVINDLLDFSKIEAGKLAMAPEAFSLRHCLTQCLTPVALRAATKGVELVVSVRGDVPDGLVGDPRRIRQILVNLLGNAVKFTEDGEVVLTVDVASREDREIVLHIAVADTGIGIPQSEQGRIFEPFHQGDDSATRKYGGTGLGLPIAEQLARMLGGRIWVESKVGVGSTFHFTTLCQLQDASAVPAEGQAATNAEALRGLNVLVVEDNASSRACLLDILAGWGTRPITAENGQAALSALNLARREGRRFQLVLLDATLGDMDAYAVLEAARKDNLGVGAAVMMLPINRRGEVSRCHEQGAAACITKPVFAHDLLQAARAALGLTPAAEPTEAESPPAETAASTVDSTSLRVLLAEDNEINQRLVTRILEKRGHRVRAVGNGREALAAIEREPFDVVLVDLVMPEMGGMEVAAILRERELATGGHVPVIAMTAHAMEGDKEKCLAGGMDGYIAKPIDPQRLVRAVDQARGQALPCLRSPRHQGDSPPATDVMDMADALARVDGDADLLREVAQLFLDSYPDLLAQLRAAANEGNTTAVAAVSHTLKGAISNFSAPKASEAVVALHTTAIQGDSQATAAALERLETQLQPLRQTLAALVARQLPCEAGVG